MGLQDRNYYGDHGNDPWSTNPDAWKGGSSGGSRRSIITIIIIINVVIFLADAFTSIPADRLAQYNAVLERTPPGERSKIPKPGRWLSSTLALKADVVQKPWNVWQLLTHGFAHASIDSRSSIFHVGFNMMALFFLGRPVEGKYGRDEFLRFYLMAIVVAGIGWVAAQWIAGTTHASAVGASGAVSAVIALFIMNYWNETVYLFGAFGVKAWVLGALMIGYDLFRAFSSNSDVAWEAHLAGMAFGAAYAHFNWNFSWMKFGGLASAVSSKPKLRVHDPDAKDEALKEQADKVLEKIAKEGEDSLTSKERRILEKYSKSLRSKNRG